MKTMKKLLLLLLILIGNNLFSQADLKEKINVFIKNNPYFNNQQEELFFLHTNKDLYFSGEKIWFAAYILNKLNEKPSLITKNLHLNLYDSDFKLVDEKLYRVKDGKTYGEFKLSEKLVSGNYYIETDTNWNKNFKKGTINKIEIINLNSKEDENIDDQLLVKNNLTKTKAVDHSFLIHRSLKVDNSTNFKIKTTKNIIKKYKGKTLFAVLHKNGISRSCAPIKINNKKSYLINFDSNILFNGVNAITLFDEKNNIVSEKYFWNYETKIGDLEIKKIKNKNDTLFLRLKLPLNVTETNMSVSILDANTKLNKYKKNILLSFLDKDYKKIKEKKDIDLFLANKTANLSSSGLIKKKKNIIHINERSLTIKGKINIRKENRKGLKVSLTSKENDLFLINELKNDLSFKFNNLNLKHPSNYKLAFFNEKGKIENAHFYVYKNFYNYKAKNTLDYSKPTIKTKTSLHKLSKNNILLKLDNDVINLDEVIVKSYRDKEIEMRKKYRNTIDARFSTFYIPDANSNMGQNLLYYLHTLPGLRVVYSPLTNTPYVFSTRGAKSFNTGFTLVNIKIDGVPLGNDLTPLIGYSTSDFEVIMVNLSGAGDGVRGTYGYVNLVLRKSYTDDRLNNKKAIEKETTSGYEISLNKYERPNIEFNSNDLTKEYGTIDWIPNLKMDALKPFILKIPISKNQDNIKLIVNGIDKNGVLIHKDINLSTK